MSDFTKVDDTAPGSTGALVVRNAHVHTMVAGDPGHSAIAIQAGRIVAVGEDRDVMPLINKHTEVIDADGRVVLPAFTDAHTHFQKAALARTLFIDLLGAAPQSLDEVLRMVGDRAQTLPSGAWIRGESLNEYHLAEHRFPNRRELDAAASEHRVVIFGTGNHVLAANSLALAAADITAATPDPSGGRIERDGDGEPTGVLWELGKLRLDPNRPDSVLPAIDAAARKAAIRAAATYLHSFGITGIHDVVMDPAEVQAYSDLYAAGELRLRVQLLVRGVESKIDLDWLIGTGFRQPFGDEWLRFGGVKLSIDGICVWRNAALYEPYPGEPANLGLIRIPRDVLDEAIARAHEHGLRVAVHAIGQRAVDMAIDAFMAAFARFGRKPELRHRIEHAYLPPQPGQLARIAASDLIVSPQPAFLWGLGDAWHEIWGDAGTTEILPLRSMLAHGLTVLASTDFPCVPIDPWVGIRAAVDRRTRSGRVLGAGQAISVAEALRMYTVAPAYAGYEERTKGTLEVGKVGDLIIISDDPFRAPASALPGIRVDATILSGHLVYRRVGAV